CPVAAGDWEAIVHTKLNPEQATELRSRAVAGEQKTLLAREFGISRQAVYAYLATWAIVDWHFGLFDAETNNIWSGKK
ncbi:MAG: Hin recombinase, partial [Magnetococcales bacterium]|nr:Hin recombinase [Magnetococcales bacterium]